MILAIIVIKKQINATTNCNFKIDNTQIINEIMEIKNKIQYSFLCDIIISVSLLKL